VVNGPRSPLRPAARTPRALSAARIASTACKRSRKEIGRFPQAAEWDEFLLGGFLPQQFCRDFTFYARSAAVCRAPTAGLCWSKIAFRYFRAAAGAPHTAALRIMGIAANLLDKETDASLVLNAGEDTLSTTQKCSASPHFAVHRACVEASCFGRVAHGARRSGVKCR
jgi:hypothetical protein